MKIGNTSKLLKWNISSIGEKGLIFLLDGYKVNYPNLFNSILFYFLAKV